VTDYCINEYLKKRLIIMEMIESIQMVIMLTFLIHVKKLPVGRVKNGEEDVSDGENVDIIESHEKNYLLEGLRTVRRMYPMVKMLVMRESASTGMRKVEEMLEGLRRAEMEVLSAMSRATSFSCSCNTSLTFC
jgi:hypothetical protein